MPEVPLSPKERQALKARAHGLKPVVLLGNAGASTPVIKEIDRALAAHELIKVRVPGDDRAERDALFAELADTLSAARVQAIGKLLVFYRPLPDETVAAEARGSRKAPSERKRVRVEPNARGARAGKPSAPKRLTPDRRDAERVNRPPAARRDPGAAHRAVGRTNRANARKARGSGKRSGG
jgi:RNA-binding protein